MAGQLRRLSVELRHQVRGFEWSRSSERIILVSLVARIPGEIHRIHGDGAMAAALASAADGLLEDAADWPMGLPRAVSSAEERSSAQIYPPHRRRREPDVARSDLNDGL